tara:strand:+ start:2120 stop:2740 length:621 start_codon:yes stop_codon:yes gene_type:complete
MVNKMKLDKSTLLDIFKNDTNNKKKGGFFAEIINNRSNNNYLQNKKTIRGGNFANKVIKTIEDIVQWIFDLINWFLAPIFWFIDYLIRWFFKPDGAMPCTWSHIYFVAFIIAIILFICENSIIILCRSLTDNILNYFNMPSFNLNYWMSFTQFYFVLIFLTFIYKFTKGSLDKGYIYLLISVLTILLQKGLIIQTIYYITGIWISI